MHNDPMTPTSMLYARWQLTNQELSEAARSLSIEDHPEPFGDRLARMKALEVRAKQELQEVIESAERSLVVSSR